MDIERAIQEAFEKDIERDETYVFLGEEQFCEWAEKQDYAYSPSFWDVAGAYYRGYKAGAEAMEKELACCGACKHWLVGDPNLIYDCDLWPQEGTALPVPDPYKVCPHFTPRKGGR
jgi:hypothetical protein